MVVAATLCAQHIPATYVDTVPGYSHEATVCGQPASWYCDRDQQAKCTRHNHQAPCCRLAQEPGDYR